MEIKQILRVKLYNWQTETNKFEFSSIKQLEDKLNR